jgi:hypothetical protein
VPAAAFLPSHAQLEGDTTSVVRYEKAEDINGQECLGKRQTIGGFFVRGRTTTIPFFFLPPFGSAFCWFIFSVEPATN